MKKPFTKNKPKKSAQQAHQVRIIGGRWKRTLLPVADSPGLRPTPDRVRETVFNWLNHLFGGTWEKARCLDLYSGSGALGFEAASRGAAKVTMVENFTPAYMQLQATKEKLKAEQVNLIRGDAERLAQRMAEQSECYDLIFLDPPYRQDLLEKILPVCSHLLAEGGIVYAESDESLVADEEKDVPEWLAPWNVLRADRAGNVFYHLLRLKHTDLKA